jgi:putative transport protein
VQIPLIRGHPDSGTTAPLVVGVVLALGRTGPIIWTLPGNVTNTLISSPCVSGGRRHRCRLLAGRALADDAVRLVILGLRSRPRALVCVIGLRTVLKYGTARALGGLTDRS